MSDEDFDGVGFPPNAPLDLGPEVVRFVGRLMTGYEAAHRRVGDLCDTIMARLNEAESVAARSLEMQIRVASEREELLSARHQREMEAELVRQRGEAVNDIARDVRSLLPLAAKRLMGAPITGNDSHGLQDLLGTMSEQQVEDVMLKGELKLSPGQRQLLAAVLQDLAANAAESSGGNGESV